ncbi:MAG: SRPBCC family protein [Thermoanaerobaculia bacterium]
MSPLGATWGVEPAEKDLAYACDEIAGPFDAAYYRGVTVEAPPATVFRWLCQLRAAPYSYDWIDNWGRRSPRELIPGLENLAVGQTVMTIFHLIDFEQDVHLTIRIRHGTSSECIFGDVAGTYLIVPRSEGGCRLLAKLRVRYPRGLWGWLTKKFLPPGDLIMMRRQLLSLKRLAEASS